MRWLASLFAPLALAFAPALALAAPLPYINAPLDTVQATVNSAITNLNNSGSLPSLSNEVDCTGTTTATCQGPKIAVSITGLTTAAGVTSATATVTDATVTAVSYVNCFVNSYAGTGNPMPVNVVPGAGSFTFAVQNTHASAALNATVVVHCMIYN